MDEDIKAFLDSVQGTLDNFDQLIHNHMTEYKTAFGRLRASVEVAMQAAKALSEVRDKALHQKIDGYKWGLVLVAVFAVISLGGFVTLAIILMLRA